MWFEAAFLGVVLAIFKLNGRLHLRWRWIILITVGPLILWMLGLGFLMLVWRD